MSACWNSIKSAAILLWIVYMPIPSRNRLLHGGRSASSRYQGKTYGDLNAVIGEDEGGVGASELGGRHGGRRVDWRGWTGDEVRKKKTQSQYKIGG